MTDIVEQAGIGFSNRRRDMMRTFVEFIDENDVILGAATFILAVSANSVMSSFVDEGVTKPLQDLTGFKDKVLTFGNTHIRHGYILLNIVSLIVTSFAVFIILKLAKQNLGFT